MTIYETEFDDYTISLSLSPNSLYLSALHNINYDLYYVNIEKQIFNNENITLKNLYNIIHKGLSHDDTIKIALELFGDFLHFSVSVDNNLVVFNHVFELVKQTDYVALVSELKKQIHKMNKDMQNIKEYYNNNNYSLYPKLLDYYDASVENKYKIFLDTIYDFIYSNDYIVDDIFNYNKINNVNICVDTITQDNIERICSNIKWLEKKPNHFIPNLDLYNYLKNRNIKVYKIIRQPGAHQVANPFGSTPHFKQASIYIQLL